MENVARESGRRRVCANNHKLIIIKHIHTYNNNNNWQKHPESSKA